MKLSEKSLKVLKFLYDWKDENNSLFGKGWVDGWGRGGHSLNALVKKGLAEEKHGIPGKTTPGHRYFKITQKGIDYILKE